MASVSQKNTDTPSSDFVPSSSFIEHASYDASALRLTLTFKSGSQYTYLYVRPLTWTAFQEADDHSSFFAKNIKGKSPSIAVHSSAIGKKSSGPLHKINQERTLDEPHGNVQEQGIKRIVRNAGLSTQNKSNPRKRSSPNPSAGTVPAGLGR